MKPTVRRALWFAGGALAASALALLVLQRRTAAIELDRLVAALRVEDDSRVADVGAGRGGFSFGLARRIGPEGRVYATEIDPERLDHLRGAVDRDALRNVTVVEASEARTGLEASCCDAAYLRDVYHHLTDPRAIGEDLHRAIVPGGHLLVIDFEPRWFLTRFFPVEGVPENRSGHGVTPEVVIEELEAVGFELEQRIEDWGFGTYAVVFRRAEAAAMFWRQAPQLEGARFPQRARPPAGCALARTKRRS